MATQLPEKLKKADLGRFALRAAQLEKARPIVSYWAEYHILQAILGNKLHLGDDETSNYAVQLMDKLETTKAANATNDAIVDDVAAKAYIENFALETFNRADESQRANKVTKQTADTFIAATTFMDLLSIWGEVDQEISAKSRFAKYHARRILQAFKAGEDPNATNPVVEEPPAPPEDGLDAELQALETQQNGSQSLPLRPATIEDDGPTALPPPPSAPQQQQNDYQVSPISAAPPAADRNSRHNSLGGGYFPSAPSAPTDAEMQDDSSVPDIPQDINPQDFYNTVAPAPATQPSAPEPRELGISSPARPSRPPPEEMAARTPGVPPAQSLPTPLQSPMQQPTYAQVPAPVSVPAPVQQQPLPTTGFRTDDEATMAAQKHARWAISALNFEDVNTAVKELRAALQSLGAG